MKITQLRNLLTAVICLFTGLSAQAQFTGTYEQRVAGTGDYSTTPVSFNLDDVAAQLGTDATTLTSAYEAWTAGTDDMFFLTLPDGTLSANYTQGGKGGFWVNASGEPQSWSNDNSALRWYNTIGMDSGYFLINIGQFPNQCSVDDVFTPKFVMKYNDKEATFDVTIKFKAPIAVPEPLTVFESQLNIVGEQEVDIAQDPRSSYDADNVWTRVGDAIVKLGISDPMILEEGLGKIIWTTAFDTETVGKLDSLTNTTTTTASPGFWYTDIRVNGEATGECSATGYGGGCYFFLEGFKYDASKDSLYVNCGQYPDKLKGGEEFFCNVYLIYGDKAYRIRYNFKANEVEIIEGEGLEGYTKVGEIEENVTLTIDGGYTYKSVNPDLDAIAALLGCGATEMQLVGINLNNELQGSEPDGTLIGAKSANNGGCWFDEEGWVVSWGGGSARMFIEPAYAGDFSDLHVGQYPGKSYDGEELVGKLYWINGKNYVAYTVHLTMKDPTVVEGDFYSVAQRSYSIQQTPSEYIWTPGIAIPTEWVEEQIGTSDWVVYGLSGAADGSDDPETRTGNDRYTRNYTCTPYPGFWMDGNGRNEGWNTSNTRIGITAAAPDGGFAMMQHAGDRCHVGDVYKTQLFLVNEENCKMVTINFTYNIVDEVVEYENVGTENIVIPVSIDDVDIDFDLATPSAALGLSVDDLVDDYGKYLYGMNEGGIFSGGMSCGDGLGFNKEGYLDMINGVVYFSIGKVGDKGVLTAYSPEEVPADFRLDVQFCFQAEGKQYVYNAKIVSKEAFDSGVRDIATSHKNAGKVFDVSGREVVKPVGGLYIINGKKFVVK